MNTLDTIMMYVGYASTITTAIVFAYIVWHVFPPYLSHPFKYFLGKKKKVVYRFPNGVLCRVGYIIKDERYAGGYAVVDKETKKTHSLNYVVIVEDESLDNVIRFN